jgi:hypothetical protein
MERCGPISLGRLEHCPRLREAGITMALTEDQDFGAEAFRYYRFGGLALGIGAAITGGFMVLFLFNPLAWAVLGGLVFAIASGFVITIVFLGIRDKRKVLIVSPIVGFVLLGVLWVLYKTEGSKVDQAVQQSQATAGAGQGKPAGGAQGR